MMPVPFIVEQDAADDLVHTLEIEVDDAGRLWLHSDFCDCATSEHVTLSFPADKAEVIAAAFMRAAREART